MFSDAITVTLKTIYIRNVIIQHLITQITYKHINNYSNDVTNKYKINKINNAKKHIRTSVMILH